jgi:hypothetical protein
VERYDHSKLVYSARWYDFRALILAGSIALIVWLGIAALATFVDYRTERGEYHEGHRDLYVSGTHIEGSGGFPFALKRSVQESAPTMFGFGIRIKLVPYETAEVDKLIERLDHDKFRCGGCL